MEERNENVIIEGLQKEETLQFSDFECSSSVTNLLKALLEFHKLMEKETVKTDAQNPFYKSNYLTLSGCLDAIIPKLNESGIVIMQMPMERDGEIYVNTRMYHAETGEYFNYKCVGVKKGKTSQDIIGDSTYLKRSSLISLLLISVSSEDDDGNQNKVRNTEGAPTQQAQPAAPRRERRSR